MGAGPVHLPSIRQVVQETSPMATLQGVETLLPYQVAEETFVIPWQLEAPPIGYFPMNSLLIRGAEPIIVDTGSPADRVQWLANVASLVDLDEVRWIFLSHDDRDHSGNLLAALEACPNATLLTTWFMVGRMFEEWPTPLDRCRFVNPGDVVVCGDRHVIAIQPPVFDNPTSRALFDERTGVLWSVDTFATNVPHHLEASADLSEKEFFEGQLFGGRLVAAWHPWLDERKYHAHVSQVQALPIEVIAGCHTPAIRGARIDAAFDVLRTLPTADPWTPVTQQDLEAMLEAMAPAGG
jgi:flavorubredoxin